MANNRDAAAVLGCLLSDSTFRSRFAANRDATLKEWGFTNVSSADLDKITNIGRSSDDGELDDAVTAVAAACPRWPCPL